MKKIIAILLALLLILSMAIPVAAVTPKLDIPKVPQISKIKFEVKLPETTEKAIENHAAEWVKKIDFSKIKFDFGD